MDRVNRLHAIARACYYLGWIVTALAVICRVVRPLEVWLSNTTRITGRNLVETGLLLFIICVASEVRAIAASASEAPAKARAQAA
jgi:hypothetical protein